MTNKKIKVILSGGGTGGHIYPAIAIANEIKKRYPNADILFVGAKDKMEMQKVPQAGYPIKGLWIAGLQRKLTLQNLLFPIKLLSSLLDSFFIVQKFKPDVAIGTGGFASGAVVKVASVFGVPTLIQEQNSFPGITNKMLAKKANAICVAYENLERFFPKDKIVFTGNPVRQDLLSINEKRNEALAFYNFDPSKTTLLVLGGSLGARAINKLIEQQLPLFEKLNIQVLWQCGKLYADEFQKYNAQYSNIRVMAFIDRMDLAYAAANLVVSRSGASSVSELCLVGKPVIFIPSPNVAEDHQTKNAKAIADKRGAELLPESELHTFEGVFVNLLNNEQAKQQMGEAIKKMAKPLATQQIVDEIEKLIRK